MVDETGLVNLDPELGRVFDYVLKGKGWRGPCEKLQEEVPRPSPMCSYREVGR